MEYCTAEDLKDWGEQSQNIGDALVAEGYFMAANHIEKLENHIEKLEIALKCFDEPHKNYIPKLDCTITELLVGHNIHDKG